MKKETQINLLYNYNLDVSERTVYLFDDIDEKSSLPLIKSLKFLDKDDGEIKLIIHSDGGNTTDGMAIIDCINNLKNPVYGYVPARACSMAVDVLIACKRRGMSKNASIMIHAGSIFVDGEVKSAMNQAEAEVAGLELLVDMWAKKLKINKKRIKELLSTDTFLYAKDALKYGFVDEIL